MSQNKSQVMETKVNLCGNKEVKLQPDGLPAIWVEMYCDRCREYQECLGFKAVSKNEWDDVNKVISKIHSSQNLSILCTDNGSNFTE